MTAVFLFRRPTCILCRRRIHPWTAVRVICLPDSIAGTQTRNAAVPKGFLYRPSLLHFAFGPQHDLASLDMRPTRQWRHREAKTSTILLLSEKISVPQDCLAGLLIP